MVWVLTDVHPVFVQGRICNFEDYNQIIGPYFTLEIYESFTKKHLIRSPLILLIASNDIRRAV